MTQDAQRFADTWHARWARWPRWLHRLSEGLLECETPDGQRHRQRTAVGTDGRKRLGPEPPGRYVRHVYTPELPDLPAPLSDVIGCSSYDAAAPWSDPTARAWLAGCEHPDAPAPLTADHTDYGAWEQGQRVGRTRAGAAYRAYLARCRSTLREAGWADDEIP